MTYVWGDRVGSADCGSPGSSSTTLTCLWLGMLREREVNIQCLSHCGVYLWWQMSLLNELVPRHVFTPLPMTSPFPSGKGLQLTRSPALSPGVSTRAVHLSVNTFCAVLQISARASPPQESPLHAPLSTCLSFTDLALVASFHVFCAYLITLCSFARV